MEKLLLFGILSLPVIVISGRTLFNTRSHGFYRFLSWECIIWLIVTNYKYWFDDPFSGRQIISWIFLLCSLYLVIAGALLLRKAGKPGPGRNDRVLYRFEKTSELVESGIFRYIRHPMYSSLIFLTWGILLKNISVELLIIAMISTLFLYFTALLDEKECISYFGDKYREYMKRSKRFIPLIF